MALLPARRNSSLARQGSHAPRWDPFAEFEDLYDRMGQLMNSAFGSVWQPAAAGWSPVADLSETGDTYVAEVELPGVKKEQIDIQLIGQDLVISGEVKDTGSEGQALRKARRSGQFEYRVTLPSQADPDKITASLADGILTVTVPKAETAKPRRIEITAS